MFDVIRKALSLNRTGKGGQKLKNEPGGLQSMGEIPRYPPFTEGIPAADASQLIETQTKLVRLIRHELALSDQEVDRLLMPLLSSFASFVHLLPASQSHHHRGAGGLFRHSLEVCMWATRISHSRIISGRETGERRKVMEPRWRMAIAVAALCHDIGKAAYDVIVTDAMGKHEWDIYHSNLVDWLDERDLSRYFIRWRGKREHKAHEKFSSLVTMRVVPPEVLSYLNEGDPEIISKMIETISGMTPSGPARVMHELVMEADQLSVSQDIKGQRIAQSDQALGVPVAKYLVDAMKRLIEDGRWKVNAPGSALWVTDNGVFLDWGKASANIASLLSEDGVHGIPKSRDNMAESLWDFDVVLPQYAPDGSERLYTPISVEELASKSDPKAFEAVEINGLETLFSGPHPTPLKAHVGEDAINEFSEQLKAKRDSQNKKQAQERDQQLQRMSDKGQSMPVMPETTTSSADADSNTGADSLSASVEAADEVSEKPKEEQEGQKGQEERPQPPGVQMGESSPAGADEKSSTRETESGARSQHLSPSSDEVRNKALVAQEFLKNLGDAGDVLREGFIPGEMAPARIDGDNVILPFPSGMSHFGEQRNEALEAIKDWIEPNPAVSTKLVQKRAIDGDKTNAVVVGREASAHLIALYDAEQETQSANDTEKQSVDESIEQTQETEFTATSKSGEESAHSSKETERKGSKPSTPEAEGRRADNKDRASKPESGKPKRAAKQDPPKPKSSRSPEKIQQILEANLAKAAGNGEVQTMADDDGVEWIRADSIVSWYQRNFDGKCSRAVVELALHAWDGAGVGYPHPDDPKKMHIQLIGKGEPA